MRCHKGRIRSNKIRWPAFGALGLSKVAGVLNKSILNVTKAAPTVQAKATMMPHKL